MVPDAIPSPTEGAPPRLLVTGGSGFIGMHLVQACLDRAIAVRSVDLVPPRIASHRPHWQAASVLDRRALGEVCARWDPHWIVHLAARSDTDSDQVEDYAANYDGTECVVAAAGDAPSMTRLIHTSTQYVHRLDAVPETDTSFSPFTAYGESKAISEQRLRQLNPSFAWTIVRPTNIWGPWHPRNAQDLLPLIQRRLYVHPDGPSPPRAYGYVGNVVAQILSLCAAPTSSVDRRVFYLGDPPIPSSEWVDAFSLALTERPARRAPRRLLAAGAKLGDITRRAGLPFPLTTTRLHNMTSENRVDLDPTLAVAGDPPFSLQEGVSATVSWLKDRRET